MDDVMGKIGDLLSDEESVRQLSELAEMFKTEMNEDSGGEAAESSDEDKSDEPTDMSGFLKIAGMVSSMNRSDKNTELLLALKPHLREDKQKKIDKAVKLLKLIALWETAKENGLLNDIL